MFTAKALWRGIFARREGCQRKFADSLIGASTARQASSTRGGAATQAALRRSGRLEAGGTKKAKTASGDTRTKSKPAPLPPKGAAPNSNERFVTAQKETAGSGARRLSGAPEWRTPHSLGTF